MVDVQKQMTSFWDALSPTRRIVAVATVIGLVAAAAIFLSTAQTPELGTLYAGLSEKDAAEVVSKLKDAKVPYELSSNGGTIKVPEALVAEMRLQLAAVGLPQGGGVGFELFDRTNLTMTDFAQRLNYQRALEGELARTISQISSVSHARVHLVIPQPELYKSNEKEASASVVLALRPGRTLDEKQVYAIANLVSGSVEGLKPTALTIVDTAGTILHDGSEAASSPARLSGTQIELQRAYEQTQEGRVRTLLDQVVGPGLSAVRVNASLDWDQVEQANEIYAPNSKPNQLRSVREVHERQPNGAAGAVGIPGTISNVPGYVGSETPVATATPAAGSVAGYERVETVQNFEISKTVEKVTRAPGTVKRLSVAVMLDESVGATQSESLSKAVAAAVGLDTARGDTLSVTLLPFNKPNPTVDPAQTNAAVDPTQEYIRTGALAGAALMAVVVLALFLRSLSRSLSPRQERQVKGKAALAAAARVLTPAEQKELAYQQLSSLAAAQPQAVAAVVSGWLSEKQ